MSDVAYFDQSQCNLDDFAALCAQITAPATVPHAADVQNNIPIYDMPDLAETLAGAGRRTLLAEWAQVLRSGAGAIVLRAAYTDTSAIDQATEIYMQIIRDEKAANGGGADHFSAGTNDRVWNSLEKLCLTDPAAFAAYFGNTAIQAGCEAWLGPNYQMTAQVNLVYPGGAAQQAHRDYHLGFQTNDVSAAYPAHVHDLSPVLTLQGAVAHCDMPIESGTTKLMPFSQAYRPGYAAWRLPAFRAFFEANYVQLALQKGDVIFFSPAIFHAAGENRTKDIQRMANLLQVSSAFGRAMETIDRTAMCKALYPVLLETDLDSTALDAAIASCAEGYSFPTNLDTDPPVGGLAPETQAALFRNALKQEVPPAKFNATLDALQVRQRS